MNVSIPTTDMTVTEAVVDTSYPHMDQYWPYRVYRAVFIYVPPVLIILGTVGNVLSMLVLLSRQMRASGVNLILTVLAMADLSIIYSSLLRIWILFISGFAVDLRAFNIHVCRLHMFITHLSVELSPMTLALMTIERAISVCAPLRAREWCSRGNTIKALAGMVTILAGINIINFVSVTLDTKLASVGHRCFFSHGIGPTYYLIVGAFESYIPFTVIFIGNGLIIYKLATAEKQRASNMAANEGGSNARNTSVMLVTISLFFLITNVPFSIYANGSTRYWPLTSPDLGKRAQSLLAYSIVFQLSLLNNCFNFVCYCVFGKAFRKAFATVVLCRTPMKSNDTKLSTLSMASALDSKK